MRIFAWTAASGLALGFASACYDPPSEDVLFSCREIDDPACPEDYRCEDDGCCHRIGSDVDANFGSCSLATASETGGESSGGEESSGEGTN